MLALVGLPTKQALAIPPFARQTGEPCNVCHTVYPQLTAFGREFKELGYTMGDSPFYQRIGAWAQGSLTHTGADQPGGAGSGFGANDNFALDSASLFFGGKITDNVGAFLQGNFDGVETVWEWDNMDVRFADQTSIADTSLVYGVSVNNNPGVQDPWNTTPVWGFPFDGSALAPTPAAATLIEGGLGQVAVGTTAYALWNDSLYVEAGLYHTLSRSLINRLAVSSDGVPASDGVAPYWRLAWQREDDDQSLSFGTFGLRAALYPGADKTSGSDTFTDIGVDLQYQYFGERDSVTTRFSLINEFQNLDASLALGGADQSSNRLHTVNGSVNYVYDKTVGLTAGVNHIWGSNDASLYGTPTGSPNSTSLTLQGDYLPLNKTSLGFYPWFNPRLTLQYVHYFKFDGSVHNVDGSGRSASDNDTLFLLLTLTF